MKKIIIILVLLLLSLFNVIAQENTSELNMTNSTLNTTFNISADPHVNNTNIIINNTEETIEIPETQEEKDIKRNVVYLIVGGILLILVIILIMVSLLKSINTKKKEDIKLDLLKSERDEMFKETLSKLEGELK